MSTDIWRADQPYNQLPKLPPAKEKVETVAVLKACIGARAALAGLKQAAELIPNQSMLINILPLLEARASSEIENIVTTTDKLFQNLNHEGAATDPATKEALRYSRALLAGYRSLSDHPLNTRTMEDVCSIIKDTEMRVRQLPGTALINDTTQKVIYTPPEGEGRLRDLLADWERFIHGQEDLDPLIRLSIAHYQFEAIHPFSDGNGRAGRVMNSLLLIQDGLLGLPILYLSRYIIRQKSEYYRLLLDVTRTQQWEEWLLFIIRGIEDTALWTTEKIAAIRALAENTATYVKQVAPDIYSHELVSLVFELPYCRIGNLVDAGLAKRQTASRYLKALVEIGVLREVALGREKLFLHPKLMTLLQAEDHTVKKYTLPHGK